MTAGCHYSPEMEEEKMKKSFPSLCIGYTIEKL